MAGEASDGLEAVAEIERLRPDLVFLDVQMPGLSGLEVLQALPKGADSPMVIFATAYDEYALAAFDANAVGYLLKPINRDRLRQAIERAARLTLNEQGRADERRRLQHAVDEVAPAPRQIVARKRDRLILLKLDDVYFFRLEGGILRAKTESDTYWTDYQIGELEKRLPAPPFFRARREVIVNLERVKEIAPFFKSTYLLVMNDRQGTEIQTSERQSKKLNEWIDSIK